MYAILLQNLRKFPLS